MKYYMLKNKNIDLTNFNHAYYQRHKDTYLLSVYSYNLLKSKNGGDKSKFLELLNQSSLEEMSLTEENNLFHRYHTTIASSLQDPPSMELMEEIKLILFANPEIEIEYLGRNLNVVTNKENKKGKVQGIIFDKDREDKTFIFDIYEGKRFYHFSYSVSQANQQSILSNHADNPKERFHHLHKWFNEDKDAKIVLGLGSGGSRMFAIPTVLKIIDMLGLRNKIDEVWGCSGGSIMGNLYSVGISPKHMEQLGHDFYNERYPDFFSKRSNVKTITSLIKNIVKKPSQYLGFATGMTDIHSTFNKAFEDYLKKVDSGIKKIPFYCISTNLDSEKIFALTEKENIKPYLEEFLKPCSRLQSMCASAAIPFIFPSEQIKDVSGTWVDGMFVEEIPMVLPILKFHLDKTNDPNYPYKKIKLFYIDLGTRMDEIPLFRYFNKNMEKFGKASLFGKVVDKLFASKINVPLEVLKLIPSIDVIGVRLKIGKMALLSSMEIPFVIQKGRESMLKELDELELKLKKSKQTKQDS